MSFPTSCFASTYSDWFVRKTTASGDLYSHEAFTAALLPRANWDELELGTRLRLHADGRSVVVKVNDRGAGDGSLQRILDLSRAAYAVLAGIPAGAVTDRNAGLIYLYKIEVVDAAAALGASL